MMQSRTNNLVGPKPIVIALTLEINQKKVGWHPYTPCVVEKGKNADNARLRVGLFADEIGANWRDKYRCCGVLPEGNDPVASTHPFAGNKIGCLMQGSSDASRIAVKQKSHNGESVNEYVDMSWGILQDVVVDLDADEKNVSGKMFRYFGFRPFNPAMGDTTDMIVGKTHTGKSAGDTTVPIYVNVTL
jgi:hypothetical protein